MILHIVAPKKVQEFMYNINKIFFILFILYGLWGVSSIITLITGISLPTYIASLSTPMMTVDELKVQQNNIILIDVRSVEEYQEYHIENSFSIPIDEIKLDSGKTKLSQIINNSTIKNPTIVFYCTSGVRSIQAYKIMKDKELKIMVLAGGINAFNNSK